jgi:hypothetical protein
MPAARKRAQTRRAIPPVALGIEWNRISFEARTILSCVLLRSLSLHAAQVGTERQMFGAS